MLQYTSRPQVPAKQTEWEPISENQSIRYSYGENSMSYQLLTDLDADSSWDILERKACGYNGQAEYECQHVFCVKSGFSIPDSITKEPIGPKTEIRFVEPEYFIHQSFPN